MKRFIYILLCVAASLLSVNASAQLRSSYFMEGTYFRTELNPALVPTRGYVAIPFISGLGMSMDNNFLSVNNFFYKNGDELVTALHESVSADKFLGRLPQTGLLGLNMNINVLGAGFYHKKSFWNFGVNLRSHNDITMSKDVFKVLKTLGNGHYDLNNTSFSSTSYAEVYVGHSRKIIDLKIGKLTAGAKVKFLIGLLNASSDVEQMYADITSENITGYMRGSLRASGLLFDASQAVAGEKITDDVICSDAGKVLGNLNNFGAAIDLGAELTLLGDRLRVSAAVVDLGFIKWSAKSYIEAVTHANFHFNGVNLDTGEADTDGEADIYMMDTKGKGYATRLNCSLNLGAEYNILNDMIGFGLLSHTEFRQNKSFSELTASVNFRPLDWISATVSHTLLSRNRLGIFGFALNVHPKGINLFLGADYIPTRMATWDDIPVPYSMKSFNVYMGLGFNLGKAK